MKPLLNRERCDLESVPRNHELNVLMYHSISDGEGPTCIPEETFRMQLDMLSKLRYQSVTLTDVALWLEGDGQLPDRPVLITFDDGFNDFSDVAWPLLQASGLGAVVFLPTGLVGGVDEWESAEGRNARGLMDWGEVRRLDREGVEFGAHTVHHWDLTRLQMPAVRQEIETSKRALEEQLNHSVLAFAPPFGRATSAIRELIGRSYRLSFGTVLGRATRRSSAWELPRVEMHYFRGKARWQAHLSGKGRWWLTGRRSIRAIRQVAGDCCRVGTRVSSAD